MNKTISLSPHKMNDNCRVYAIGDIHGYIEPLKQMHDLIMADIERHPCDDVTILHLGDYINRGPDSAGTLEFLSTLSHESGLQYAHVMGNHENGIIEFVDDPDGKNREWPYWPDEAFLKSYGINPENRNAQDLAALINETVPDHHWDFIRTLPYYIINGDFLFIHNGPRPGVKLEAQKKEDLIYNREPFMSATEPHEYYVVHGHTIMRNFEVEILPNRMNLETGIYNGGPLTCGVFEQSDVRFIQIAAVLDKT